MKRETFVYLMLITGITVSFHLCLFFSAEHFENLILFYVTGERFKDEVQKRLIEAFNRYESLAWKKKKKPFLFLENESEKILEQSQWVVDRD